jgi:hypothetical protein
MLAAVFLFFLLSLPPGPKTATGSLDPTLVRRTIPGAYHVHSIVSDGTQSRDAIAAAAADAGLRFVIFTDHGDGMREPEPAHYVHGVLCIDGVEISTNGGHYVALDMRPSEYPLAGEASAVVEDVRRLGGFGIAAHPHSAKPELGWTDWSAPIDGIEWLNADSEWRDESSGLLLRLPFSYLVRPAAALASILDQPTATLARWDSLMARGPVVALAGHDAHGGIGAGQEDGVWFAVARVPSYEASFRSFALRAVVASPLSGSAPDDARLVLDAIRRGRVFTGIDAVAAPAFLDFTAHLGSMQGQMGDSMTFQDGVELVARSTLPPGASLVMVCGGREAGQSTSGDVRIELRMPAACRPEVRAPGSPGTPPVPWLVGNPIYLSSLPLEAVGSEPRFETSLSLHDVVWIVEKDPGSEGHLSIADSEATLHYRLKTEPRVSQYLAAVAGLKTPTPAFDRIVLDIESSVPMRVSVQLRFEGGDRWLQSIYVEPDVRRAVIPVDELVRAGAGDVPRPDFREATSILFIVDLTNALPGASGWFKISNLSFARLADSR